MAKHRADEPKSFGTGERKNASPNGWADRVEIDKKPGEVTTYGWGKDGVEGWHKSGK